MDGFGLKVNARYFVQVFDFKRSPSLQRMQQILIDQPMQQFHVFDKSIDLKNISGTTSHKKQHKSITQLVETKSTNSSVAQTDELTFRVHPAERNKILVRVENLADRFDIANS